MSEIVKRCERLAFYGVPDESADGRVRYCRMKGFDTITTNKNPKEYTRQYIDEEFEQTDVVGYTPSVSFGFDKFSDDAVHTDIASIFDNEKTGNDAVREIIMVDMTGDEKTAIKRSFSLVAESEGDGKDAYTYSGSLRAKGKITIGSVSSADDWQTCTFSAAV